MFASSCFFPVLNLTRHIGRALDAPQIRRLFSCSPRDPRYHMLEHLSPKFKMSPMEREPRAALILNRFTRTLTVMFATEAISAILGVPADQVLHKSFYECIRESSLADACQCLESAKANDSIAYLRFWSRDPRRPEDFDDEDNGEALDDQADQDGNNGDTPRMNMDSISGWNEGVLSHARQLPGSRRSSDSEGCGVGLRTQMDMDLSQQPSPPIKMEPDVEMADGGLDSQTGASSAFSSASGTTNSQSSAAWSSPASIGSESSSSIAPRRRTAPRRMMPSVELEAVVSCTSDGLVVILRRARPPIPDLRPPLLPFAFDNGLFAAPWGQRPIRPHYSPEVLYNFRPPYLPQHMPLRENVKAAGGPPIDQLMKSIRDVAVFAWAVVGINGNLASYSRGLPIGESQPVNGLPIWDPATAQSSYLSPEGQAAAREWLDRHGYNGIASGQDSPTFEGRSRHDGTTNPEGYAVGTSDQWPSLTSATATPWSFTHNSNPTYMQTPPAGRHVQADEIPPGPSRWDDDPGYAGNYQLSSEPGQDGGSYRHLW